MAACLSFNRLRSKETAEVAGFPAPVIWHSPDEQISTIDLDPFWPRQQGRWKPPAGQRTIGLVTLAAGLRKP